MTYWRNRNGEGWGTESYSFFHYTVNVRDANTLSSTRGHAPSHTRGKMVFELGSQRDTLSSQIIKYWVGASPLFLLERFFEQVHEALVAAVFERLLPDMGPPRRQPLTQALLASALLASALLARALLA